MKHFLKYISRLNAKIQTYDLRQKRKANDLLEVPLAAFQNKKLKFEALK